MTSHMEDEEELVSHPLLYRFVNKYDQAKKHVDGFIVFCIVGILTVAGVFLIYFFVNQNTDKILRQRCAFTLIASSTTGGTVEDGGTAFFISQGNTSAFISFDAGNLMQGTDRFLEEYGFLQGTSIGSKRTHIQVTFPSWAKRDIQRSAYFVRNHIFGFFIGHSHLDHIAGLMYTSPFNFFTPHAFNYTQHPPDISQPKPIVAMHPTIVALQDHYFNDVVWPDLPAQGYFNYMDLNNSNQNTVTMDDIGLEENITSDLHITGFPVCHGNVPSTAFLLSYEPNGDVDSQLIYFSDTGISSNISNCDWQQRFLDIWTSSRLHIDMLSAIVIEVSFPDDTPEEYLFGHLRPQDVVDQLVLLKNVTETETLEDMTVVIQHVKPSVDPVLGADGVWESGENTKDLVRDQITQNAENAGIEAEFILPQQGQALCIKHR
eukprot:gb/GECH01008508.1/.p1 GENE.gb/GECH01008508.1/~~gb/GECH01008508.1/.p1  ORF type:complete len:432 (+),score=100.75 gb/GECH01008508.1/:1-1296(+)